MTTLTVQAEDTATAMEQIADQLGADALILSTTKRDGKIIMRASNDSPMPAGKKPEKAGAPEFSSLFAAASRPGNRPAKAGKWGWNFLICCCDESQPACF